VGKSLYNVLSAHYPTEILDIYQDTTTIPNILHICYPYSDKFVEITKAYIDKYKPEITVIHSTVKVGTTRLCGENVVFSPVRGKHPNLTEGLMTFVKEVACVDNGLANEVAEYFEKTGMKAGTGMIEEEAEFAKIMCTTRYGVDIAVMHEMYKECEKRGFDFEQVYTRWNEDYNEGYRSLGDKQFVRPVLKYVPGKIGGHCVVNNCHLDNNLLTTLVYNYNETL